MSFRGRVSGNQFQGMSYSEDEFPFYPALKNKDTSLLCFHRIMATRTAEIHVALRGLIGETTLTMHEAGIKVINGIVCRDTYLLCRVHS